MVRRWIDATHPHLKCPGDNPLKVRLGDVLDEVMPSHDVCRDARVKSAERGEHRREPCDCAHGASFLQAAIVPKKVDGQEHGKVRRSTDYIVKWMSHKPLLFVHNCPLPQFDNPVGRKELEELVRVEAKEPMCHFEWQKHANARGSSDIDRIPHNGVDHVELEVDA